MKYGHVCNNVMCLCIHSVHDRVEHTIKLDTRHNWTLIKTIKNKRTYLKISKHINKMILQKIIKNIEIPRDITYSIGLDTKNKKKSITATTMIET